MNKNIFEIPKEIKEEFFETLIEGNGEFKVERIVSTGQITAEGQWYDQDRDEWVVLLQGEAQILFIDDQNNEKINKLSKGDYLFIKAHEKHRVVYTSTEPPCVWIAIHGNKTEN
jgi:cupin 2 domain-containing protein